jgi:hypothetical protein
MAIHLVNLWRAGWFNWLNLAYIENINHLWARLTPFLKGRRERLSWNSWVMLGGKFKVFLQSFPQKMVLCASTRSNTKDSAPLVASMFRSVLGTETGWGDGEDGDCGCSWVWSVWIFMSLVYKGNVHTLLIPLGHTYWIPVEPSFWYIMLDFGGLDIIQSPRFLMV